jgi:hypothetical protein
VNRICIIAVAFGALALAGCAAFDPVIVHEAPRVTVMEVPPALLAPCLRAKDGAPDSATATNLDAARYVVILAARNDACGEQVDALRVLLAP